VLIVKLLIHNIYVYLKCYFSYIVTYIVRSIALILISWWFPWINVIQIGELGSTVSSPVHSVQPNVCYTIQRWLRRKTVCGAILSIWKAVILCLLVDNLKFALFEAFESVLHAHWRTVAMREMSRANNSRLNL